MKAVMGFGLSVFIVLSAGATERESSRFDDVLNLIEKRNAHQICESDAYQETIIEMAARAVAMEPEKLQEFISRIPQKSDILANLQFKALLANKDLLSVMDQKEWEDLLTGTTFYSGAGGVFGPAYILKLEPHGTGTVIYREFLGAEPWVKEHKINVSWRGSTEVEPGGDYYQFLEVTIDNAQTPYTKLLYMLKKDLQGNLLFEEGLLPSEDQRSKFFFTPDDCSA